MRDSTTNKRKQLEALKNVKGIQCILNKAYKILGNPILTHDDEYKLIAYTDNITTDDPIWVEIVTNGTVGPERLEFYKNEYFFDTVANAEKITFLLSDKLKYDRIFGKIYDKDYIQVGCACMVACNKPFDETDPELFEIVCDLITRELEEDEFYNQYGQSYLETLVSGLIDGDFKDKKLYTAHVEIVYKHLKTYIYLSVVDVNQCGAGPAQLAYYRDLFKNTEPAFKYSVYSNYILIIFSTENVVMNAEKDMNKLNQIFIENNMFVGISSSFENLFELHKYYQEATDALNYGINSHDGGQIFLYDEVREKI